MVLLTMAFFQCGNLKTLYDFGVTRSQNYKQQTGLQDYKQHVIHQNRLFAQVLATEATTLRL